MDNFFRALISIFFLLQSTLVCASGNIPEHLLQDINQAKPKSTVTLTAIDNQKELQFDSAKTTPGPLRFAVAKPVKISPDTHGEWIQKTPGTRLWYLRIHVNNATDLNLAFSSFQLPKNSRLYFVNRQHDYLDGPYTAQNNKKHLKFWTPVMPGSDISLLLYIPENAIDQLKLTITKVNAGYRDLYGTNGLPNLAKQGSCNIDTACQEANPWRDEVRSVARISIDGTGLCTATLMMDAINSFRPYLLTAHHCGVTPANATSIVTYWNYQSPSCGNLGGGSLSQNQSGAIFRASKFDVDMTLIELDEMPGSSFNVYYSGWNHDVNAAIKTVGIHHPNADEKAISFNNDVLRSGQSCIGTSTKNTHWFLNWEQGTTEPGSSGSGLWNTQHQLIGTLSGGLASCSNRSADDCYGRLTSAWDDGQSPAERLIDWLDPEKSNTLSVNGSNLPPTLPKPDFVGLENHRTFAAGSQFNIRWRPASPIASYQLDYSTQCSSDIIFQDGMENVTDIWTSSQRENTNDWTLNNHSHRGQFAWFAHSPDFSAEQTLTLEVPGTITPQAILSIWHEFDLESGYDGGIIEFSTDGNDWQDAAAWNTQHGYSGTISTNAAAYSGSSNGYIESRFTLDEFAGQQLFIRFRLLTDSSVNRTGWYIDDLSILIDKPIAWTPIATTEAGSDHFNWLIPDTVTADACLRLQGSAPGYRSILPVISPAFSILDISPELNLTASINHHSSSRPGPEILTNGKANWKYFIKNNGNVAIRDVELREKQKLPATGEWQTICNIRLIPPGQTRNCLKSADVSRGSYKSLIVARGRLITGDYYEKAINAYYRSSNIISNTPPPAHSSVDFTTGITVNNNQTTARPGISITAGSALNWTYSIENTGSETLHTVNIRGRQKLPERGAWMSLCQISEVLPGASKSCSWSSTAIEGHYMALVVANANTAANTGLTKLVKTFYQGLPLSVTNDPSFFLTVLANGLPTNRPGPTINSGKQIIWTYTLDNNGSSDLQNITLKGRQKIPFTGNWHSLCNFSVIHAGESKSCQLSEIAANGFYKMLVTAQSGQTQVSTQAFYQGR
ncbi:MAG: trypsin-like serine protease [Gammaproteobacteria bacterium]